MSAPFERRGPTHIGTGGTLLALHCAQNVYAAVDRRMPEARALAGWLAEDAAAFGLSDAALPDEWNGLGRSRRGGVAMADWRKLKAALDSAATALPSLADAPINRWTAAIRAALELDPVSTRILALAPAWCMDRHRSSGRFLNNLSCLALPSGDCRKIGGRNIVGLDPIGSEAGAGRYPTRNSPHLRHAPCCPAPDNVTTPNLAAVPL